jgi:hypothetical protein
VSEAGRFVDQNIWVEWYDGYDKAFIRWLLNRVKRDGKAVPTVFAAPERAFGQLLKVLNGRKHGVRGKEYTLKTIPLPFMSLSRLTDRMDFERRWHKGRLRKLQALDAQGNRMPVPKFELPDGTVEEIAASGFNAWEQQDFPSPVVIPYQLDAWARNLRDLDLIYKYIVWAFSQSGDLAYMTVKNPEPWGAWLRPIRWLGMTNNSNLEVAGDGSERTLRYTFTFEIDAYILMPSESVKAVKAAQLDVREWETEELIEIWTIYDVRTEDDINLTQWDADAVWDSGFGVWG